VQANTLQRPTNVTSGQAFESFLYGWSQFIREQQYFNTDLTQAAVTMHIRARAVTTSDLCSGYGTRESTQGTWMSYNPDLDGEVHPINIVGPAVTTNKNACLQSNAAVEVSSANQSAEHKQIALRWQRICDYFERMTWDEAKRGFIFDSTQKEGTNLVEIYLKELDPISIPNVNESKTGLAVFKCECGKNGITQIDEFDEETNAVECPECGNPAPAMISPVAGLALGEQDVPVYEIKDRTIPFFNFMIDTWGAKVGGLQTANWLQIQDLKDQTWMETHYPGRSFGGPALWAYPLQAAYALSIGRWQFLNQQPLTGAWTQGHERYDVKEIYLHEDSYSSYRAPEDYEFIDAFGKCTFRIRKGQSIMDAQREMYGENQHGFKFTWTQDTLLGIADNEKEELNFRERFSDVHWSRESGGYLSSPNYSIVYIQDDITLLNTLNHNIIARNAVNPIFYDSLVFEKGDFNNEYIGTKNGAMLPDFDMRKAVTSLPIPTPSPYLSQQMQWLWSIKDSVSQVTPAMRGESQKGEPFAAQRQQLETSYGNLTAILKSFAQCKVNTFKNQALMAKKRWTLEQFQRVGSMFGEQWNEEDIDEMCSIDFHRDLMVTYREGSETPSTPISKELRFFGALGQLAQLPPEIALQVIGTEQWQKIVEKMGDIGDFGFDVSGLQIDDVISQKRFISLAQQCQEYQGITFEEITALREEIVAYQPVTEEEVAMGMESGEIPQPTPITQFDLMTEQILYKSGIRFTKYEDLAQQQSFFVQQYNVEMGKTSPNEMLLAQIEILLGMLDQALGQQKQAELEANPEYQAQQAEIAAVEKDRAVKAASEASKIEMDKERIGIEHKRLDIEEHKAERKDLLDAMVVEEETDPMDEISISYEALPPDGQVQVAKNAGIEITTAQVKTAEKDRKPPKPTVTKK